MIFVGDNCGAAMGGVSIVTVWGCEGVSIVTGVVCDGCGERLSVVSELCSG